MQSYFHRSFQTASQASSVFPLVASVSQQQFLWNRKVCFLPAMPSSCRSNAHAFVEQGISSTVRRRFQAARECLACKLNLSQHWMPELSYFLQKGSFQMSLILIIGKLYRWPFTLLQHQNPNIDVFHKCLMISYPFEENLKH